MTIPDLHAIATSWARSRAPSLARMRPDVGAHGVRADVQPLTDGAVVEPFAHVRLAVVVALILSWASARAVRLLAPRLRVEL